MVCRHAESSVESKREKSIVVKEAGGVGMILIDETGKNVAIPFLIPSAIVGMRTGNHILSYINRTRSFFRSMKLELDNRFPCVLFSLVP